MTRRAVCLVSVLAVAVGLLGTWSVGPGSAAVGSVRGFDGKTITVAGFGVKTLLPGAETGARARIERFNRDNEIKGVKIELADFADDKGDPATALSEARRLVTQEQVFAIVADISASNPGQYFNQQHVPYFGAGYDSTYCSDTPTTKLYGFGIQGCLVPSNPKFVPDNGFQFYEYVSSKTGTKRPTLAIFSSDTASGKSSVRNGTVWQQGAGFDVTFAKALVPPPPVGDYTPYVQQLLTADDGEPPDAMYCLLTVDCIGIYQGLKANGYDGVFLSSLYSDVLVKALSGSAAGIGFTNLTEKNPALDRLRADVEAVKPGAAVDTGVEIGYASTDFFIQALKTAAKRRGVSRLTPEAVQQAAAKQTWEIEGLAGPIEYPASTAVPTPSCSSIVVSDGTAWTTVEPYGCSRKKFPVK